MDVLRVTTPPNVQNNIPAGAPQQPPPQAANMGNYYTLVINLILCTSHTQPAVCGPHEAPST